MKKLTKMLSLSLTLAMLIGLLAGCGGAGGAAGNSAGLEVDPATLAFPLAETATITGLTNFPAGTESEPNPHHLQTAGRANQCPCGVEDHPV